MSAAASHRPEQVRIFHARAITNFPGRNPGSVGRDAISVHVPTVVRF
ncbi:hypothetical protein ACWCRF_30755 [Streptomyces sp. NPDC002405]